MKKIIFLMLIFSVQLFARVDLDTIKASGSLVYWTETVRGANPSLSQKGDVVGATVTSDTLKTATANLISPILGVKTSTGLAKDLVRNNISNTKFLVGLNIMTAYSSVSATLILQGSGDGTYWATLSTLSSNTAPSTTGVTWYPADLSGYYLPYYRVVFNNSAQTVNRVGKLRFLYSCVAP